MGHARSWVRSLGSRLTYANVVSTLALVAVLTTSGAYAATKLINGRQIKHGTVGTAQLADGAVTAKKLARGVRAGTPGPRGATGAAGPQGAPGQQGDKGEKGDTGTVDTSDFYDKAASDARFQPKLDHVKLLGGGSPAQNGAALMAAVASIPTPTGPQDAWLVKLQPGRYDLSGATLNLKPYVDLEGSGANTTEVISSKDAGNVVTVSAASHAEVRDVTVSATSPTDQAAPTAVRVNGVVTGFTVRDAVLRADGGNRALGLESTDIADVVDLENVTVTAASSFISQVIGIASWGKLTVRNSSVTAIGDPGSDSGTAIVEVQATAGHSVVIQGSALRGGAKVFSNLGNSEPIRVFDSQVDAPATAFGTVTCMGSWKGDYTATTAGCG